MRALGRVRPWGEAAPFHKPGMGLQAFPERLAGSQQLPAAHLREGTKAEG